LTDTTLVTKTDRFGNPITGELPYARGRIIASTDDDYRKITKAHYVIRTRLHRGEGVFNFSGLERAYPAGTDDIGDLDDETAPALYEEEFRKLGLQHLGGSPLVHDVFLANRLTAATMATHLTMVKPGQTVVGVAPSYSHPTVIRATNLAGGRFVDTTGLREFSEALDRERNIGLVDVTRLAVTYDMIDTDTLKIIIGLARSRGLPIFVDDAGGARVGPAIFGQPKSLELDVDVAATGLDKYGVYGPRFGLLGGKKELMGRIKSKAWQIGLEARPIFLPAALKSLQRYDPERVRLLVQTTKEVGSELKKLLGTRVRETPVVSQLLGEDILELVMERGNIAELPMVPFEATAAVAMNLLQDYGVVTVHFAGVPPGTSALLIKFVPPETLERFGGAKKLAQAVDASITKAASQVAEPDGIQRLLYDFGAPN
jgi:L-seryl-tRNA(Ser) seleniumtransferase